MNIGPRLCRFAQTCSQRMRIGDLPHGCTVRDAITCPSCTTQEVRYYKSIVPKMKCLECVI